MTKKTHWGFILAIICLWVITAFIVNPIGNFPLNDDWVYAGPVKFLLCTGQYKITDSVAPTLIAQVLWGALFCLPCGFSFTALRISSLVLGCLACVGLYLLAFYLSKNKKLSFMVSLLLMANPIFFSLSNTFMTDVPFLAFAIGSILFFCKALEQRNLLNIALAIVFSVLATLTRQVGIIIPLAYAIALSLAEKNGFWQRIKCLIPLLVTSAALYAYMWWMSHAGSLFSPYQGESGVLAYFTNPAGFVYGIFMRTGCLLYYTGFFLLPILLFSAPAAFAALSTRLKKITVICTALFIPMLTRVWGELPIGNILNDDGIGPKTLKDTYALHINLGTGIPPGMLYVLLAFGFIGAILIIVNYITACIDIAKAYRQKSFSGQSVRMVFLILCLSVYCFIVAIPHNFFDRYLLPVFVITALVSLKFISDTPFTPLLRWFAFAFIAAIITVSTLATHDYLAWNRARQQATDYLGRECKIPHICIDGGYEFNGWRYTGSGILIPDSSLQCTDEDKYTITFGEIAGYNVIKQVKYEKYIPRKEECIYILRKK